MNPIDVVLAFFEAINRHDVNGLAELMTEDHVFIDSLGQSTRGREKIRAGWQGYFSFCPNYRISHQDICRAGDTVGAFGSAGGTIQVDGKLLPENIWQTPAAWRAIVPNGLIKEWQVYADNKPVYDILAKRDKPATQ